MKERPILFSPAMVRALLDGRKTQTRRIVKPQPVCSTHEFWEKHPDFVSSFNDDGSLYCGVCGGGNKLTRTDVTGIRNPYGVVGDRLWVRETFAPWRRTSVEYPLEFDTLVTKDERHGLTLNEYVAEYGRNEVQIAYRADGDDEGWIPSIFMPRWVSRILLEITSIRVERLQDISEEDCIAEGVDLLKTNCDGECGQTPCGITRQPYISLWESINGKDSWKENPFVWCVSFRRIDG